MNANIPQHRQILQILRGRAHLAGPTSEFFCGVRRSVTPRQGAFLFFKTPPGFVRGAVHFSKTFFKNNLFLTASHG